MRRLLGALLAIMVGSVAIAVMTPASAAAQVAVGISVGAPPPPLPIYDQPPIPEPGYMWTPGYWAYGPYGYYWVPGTWVLPPEPGFLWTPAYWDWDGGAFVFNAGYWGPVVGFYGGIDYGFGYFGVGYAGGYWDHDRFFYNRSVNNFGGARIASAYNRTVSDPVRSRVSYNGGAGGMKARPTGAQMAAAHQFHAGPTALQARHQQLAAASPALRAATNHGRPAVAATSRPASFGGAARTSAARSSMQARLAPNRAQSLASRSGVRSSGALSAERHATPASATVGRSLASRHISRVASASRYRSSGPAFHASRAAPATPRYAERGGMGGFGRGAGGGFAHAAPAMRAPAMRAAAAPARGGGGGGGGHRPPR